MNKFLKLYLCDFAIFLGTDLRIIQHFGRIKFFILWHKVPLWSSPGQSSTRTSNHATTANTYGLANITNRNQTTF